MTAHHYINVLYILYFLIQGLNPMQLDCNCRGPKSSPPLVASTNFSPQEEIINGVNYGIPQAVGNIQVLLADVTIRPSMAFLNATCPIGYRIPTQKELTSLFIGNDADFLKNTLKIQSGQSYVSSTKSNPGLLTGNVGESWEFNGYDIDDTFLVTESAINTFFQNGALTKCVFDLDQNRPLSKYPKDFVSGFDYPVTLLNLNYKAFVFQTENNTYTDPTFSVKYYHRGCHTLEFYAINLADQNVYNCRKIYVKPYSGSESGDTVSSIKTISTGNLAVRSIYLFWNRGNAPIAPNEKTGGFYTAFTGADNSTYIQEYDANMTKIREINLNMSAYVMDIVSTEPGVSLYLKDINNNDKSYLVGYNQNFTQLYNRVIMNNGMTPSKITEQISFYDKNGKIMGGMEAMFSASSGKLTYGRDRVGLLFSHYNAFGTADKRNDHQGDTFYTFNRIGQKETAAWSWKTSHSLYQTQMYDGQFYITASLGDMFPTNIRVCVIYSTRVTNEFDGVRKDNVFNPYTCKDIVPGNIPGDGNGGTCGRIGGLARQGSTYSLTYSRKPCSIRDINGKMSINNEDEIGLITFNINNFGTIINIKKFKIGEATKITALRSAKYGKNIFITYLWSTDDFGLNPPTQYVVADKAVETQYAMVVDFAGNIVTKPFIVEGDINISPSDDMRILNDGKVVWANILLNGQLFINYLAAPTPMPVVDTTSVKEDSVTILRHINTLAIPQNVNFVQLRQTLKRNYKEKNKRFLKKY